MHEYCDTVNRIKIQYVTINAEDDFKINILPVSREYRGLQEVSGTNRSFGHRTPYLTWHINRFGRYDLDMEKQPPELLYDLWTHESQILMAQK